MHVNHALIDQSAVEQEGILGYLLGLLVEVEGISTNDHVLDRSYSQTAILVFHGRSLHQIIKYV